MKISELRMWSDEDLHKLSLQRHKSNHRSTGDALKAQQILWERAGKPFQSEQHWIRDHTLTGVKF